MRTRWTTDTGRPDGNTLGTCRHTGARRRHQHAHQGRRDRVGAPPRLGAGGRPGAGYRPPRQVRVVPVLLVGASCRCAIDSVHEMTDLGFSKADDGLLLRGNM